MFVIELRFIHQEMGSLRDENHKQNMEIASLKETVQLQNKTISQHEATIKQLTTDNHWIIKSDHPASSVAKTRRKRPAQITPTSDLYDERLKGAYNQKSKLFIGPPTNCSDLNRLGYTLNGFYMVRKPTNGEKSMHKTILYAVYCTFKQEGAFDPSLVEKPVLPPPFSSPMLPPDDDVHFWFTAFRDKKDQSGVLTFTDPSKLNRGNGFDGKTGYFKAPRFGIYHFLYEMTFGRRGNNETSVDFYMNDALVVNSFSSISQNFGNKIRHEVTLKLNLGDSICLKAKNKNNANSLSSEPDMILESIMGFLVKATFF